MIHLPAAYRKAFTFLPVVLLLAGPLSFAAAQYEPPASYYNSATGTGSTLKQQLHDIIDNHTVRSYGDARTILQDTDVDPNDSDNIILVYNRVALDVSGLTGSIPGWDSGVSWNREHTWPRSRGVDSSGADNSDLHQLRPSDPGVNSSRSNLNFGGEFGAQSFGSVSDGGATYWYPGDADAGMIARQQFYMAVRYDGSDSSTTDLELSSGNPASGINQLGNLDRLIEWHFAATPDDFELRRNDRIYDSYQFNRNPFIDRPEYAWSVLVDQENDSQITIAGGSSTGDGATELDVDLGAVIVGAAVPADVDVTLDKAGQDGTYYNVTASGDATSSLSGSFNAFRSSQTDSTTVSVGLSTSTATAGLKTGAVTIDNLDITTSGGAGRGDNDGDDVIDVSLTVLDHATPSFDPATEVVSLAHDFGSVSLGDPSPQFDFDLYNLANDPAFTAALELTSVVGAEDTAQFTTTLAPFSGVDAIDGGQSQAESVSLLTSTLGAFSVVYTLTFSDENLPGAMGGYEMLLALTGEVVSAGLAGDFNLDGVVDAADYATWRNGLGVDYVQADYDVWRANYGATSGSGSASNIPEPAALLLAMVSLLGLVSRRR